MDKKRLPVATTVTLYEKMKLLMGLISGEIAQVGPFYASVNITRRCNLQCIGCHFRSRQVPAPSPTDPTIENIPLELFKKLCDELNRMGTYNLWLSGEGEPFFHPQLYDLIALAKEAGLHVGIYTNGTLLDENGIRSLIDTRLDLLRVSIWATSPEEYKKNYPGTDFTTFFQIKQGLKLLASLKAEQKRDVPTVVLHQPINRYNYQNLEAVTNLALTTGCNNISFTTFKDRRGILAEAALTPDEVRAVCHTLIQIKNKLKGIFPSHYIDRVLREYSIGEAVWEKMPCYIGWINTYVKMDGTVLPCCACNLPVGNLRENSLQEIWNGPAYRTFRRQTLSRSGLMAMNPYCDCSYCGYAEDNDRVHRIFKWLRPFFIKERI